MSEPIECHKGYVGSGRKYFLIIPPKIRETEFSITS